MLAGSFMVAARPAAAAVRHHGVQVWLSRPSRTGGCCALKLTRLTADAAAVEDARSRFDATASRFLLARSRLPGYILLWVYVVERNEQNVAETMVSGPANWLLIGNDGVDRYAYSGVPRRQSGVALTLAAALSADTNPANEGWIWFRVPARSSTRYTLAWDDCRPRCNPAAGRSSFAPVVDVTIGRSPQTRHGRTHSL